MPKFWPVITMKFHAPPLEEQWAFFSSQAENDLGCLGFEESEDGRQARLFFPAIEANGREETGAAFNALFDAVEGISERYLAGVVKKIDEDLLPDQDWGVTWRQYFHLVRVGERIYCGPPWEKELPADAPQDAFALVIDPGQAFGTGTHETTQLCLALLEKQVKPGEVWLDVGTGSGILAFGAVRLGAECVLGVEYDPVCEENFWKNAELNGVKERVRFLLGADPVKAVEGVGEEALPRPDVIVCNMLMGRFLPLLESLRSFGVPLLLSGYLITEAKEVQQAVRTVGFEPGEETTRGEWAACVCRPIEEKKEQEEQGDSA